MLGFSETISLILCIVSLVSCLLVLGVYKFIPSARIHPNQIIVHRVFSDFIFSIAYLISLYLKSRGDDNCQSELGVFTSILTQYSLLASELIYFFLAVDGLIAVSRPFSNIQYRYFFYAFFSHVVSIVLANSLLLLPKHVTGRHVSGICWIGQSTSFFNFYSWIYMYIWVIVIYISSCVLLACMASCLSRLPIYHEELLKYRANILEKMMSYVFVFIVYGLSLCLLYSLIEMINYHFHGWSSHFTTTTVLQTLFYWVLTSHGIVTSWVFLQSMFQTGSSGRKELWTREIQPLLNTVIRRQLLDIFSRGVTKAIESSTYRDNNDSLFGRNGCFNDITSADHYYKEVNVITIQASTQRRRSNEEDDNIRFTEYAPLVFSYLRWLHKVNNTLFINEMTGLSDCTYSEGSSGSFFVRSKTQRYIIKFVNKSEFMVLKEILKDLTEYLTSKMSEYPNSIAQGNVDNFPPPESREIVQNPNNINSEVVEEAFFGSSIQHAYSTQQPPSQSGYSFHPGSLFQDGCISPQSIVVGDNEVMLGDTPFVSTAPFQHTHSSHSHFADEDPQTPLLFPHRMTRSNESEKERANSYCITPVAPPPDITCPKKSNSFDENMHSSDSSEYQICENRVNGSFLNKYYGMYSLEVFGSTVYFVVMENILPLYVSEVYDLKGSSIDRESRKPTKGQFVTCQLCQKSYRYGVDTFCDREQSIYHKYQETKKDNNFRPTIIIDKQLNQQISSQLLEDAKFLCNHGLMDYSVLLGIRNVYMDISEGFTILIPENPSQTLYTSKIIEGPGIYYIGVIDYLQKYNIKKKLERFWKVGIRCKDKTAISDMPPIQYRDRIIEKIMNKLFLSYEDNMYAHQIPEDYNQVTEGNVVIQPSVTLQPEGSQPSHTSYMGTSMRSRHNSTATPGRQDSVRSVPSVSLVGGGSSSRVLRARTLDSHIGTTRNPVTLDTNESPLFASSSSRQSVSQNEVGERTLPIHQESENHMLEPIAETGNDTEIYYQNGVV